MASRSGSGRTSSVVALLDGDPPKPPGPHLAASDRSRSAWPLPSAHALRHTFCTMLAERGVALEVIGALAGHVNVRTTQIYVGVSGQRKADGISALKRICHPLAA
jgi:integrase